MINTALLTVHSSREISNWKKEENQTTKNHHLSRSLVIDDGFWLYYNQLISGFWKIECISIVFYNQISGDNDA